MKKYWFHSTNRNVKTTIEAEQVFWNGMAAIFVKGGQTIAIIALLPGDLVIEDGCFKDVEPEAPAKPLPDMPKYRM